MLMKAGGRIMSAADYEESLREYNPTVYVDGDLVESVADDPRLKPGVRAVGGHLRLCSETGIWRPHVG